MFNAFADQDFTFSPLELASYQGLSVKNFNFTSTLRGPNASLTVMAYMFQDEGNITFGNETSEIRKGMLKFNIQVERGDCSEISPGSILLCKSKEYIS